MIGAIELILEDGREVLNDISMSNLLIEECDKFKDDKSNKNRKTLKNLVLSVLENEGHTRRRLNIDYEGKTAWDIMRKSNSENVRKLIDNYLYLINNHFIYAESDGRFSFTKYGRDLFDNMGQI